MSERTCHQELYVPAGGGAATFTCELPENHEGDHESSGSTEWNYRWRFTWEREPA